MSEAKKIDQADLGKLSLTELMARLDEIVAWFNGPDVNLDEATKKFDEGAELAAVIKKKLAEADNKVNQIKLKLDEIEGK